MTGKSKPRAGITENQDTYLRDELRISKAEANEILDRRIEKIADLTKSQAHQVISGIVDRTILTFHPGTEIEVDLKISKPEEGLPVTFRGTAIVKHYQYQMTDEGLYMNIVFHIPSLDRTVTRGMSFFRQSAKVKTENVEGIEMAKQQLVKYHRLQQWHQVLIKSINRIWWNMLHDGQLPTKALKVQSLVPGLKKKLIRSIMGELERTISHEDELSDAMIQEALKAVVGYVIFD